MAPHGDGRTAYSALTAGDASDWSVEFDIFAPVPRPKCGASGGHNAKKADHDERRTVGT